MASNTMFQKRHGKSNRRLSKKNLFGLIRITNGEGKRVWMFQGEQMDTLREVVVRFRLTQMGMKI